MSATPLDRARLYVRKVPPAIQGQDGSGKTIGLAIALVRKIGLSASEAWPLMADWNRGCQPPWSERELQRKISEALRITPATTPGRFYGSSARPAHSDAPAWPPAPLVACLKDIAFDESKLATVAARLPGVDENWLAERSPIVPDCMNAISFLTKLYRPGEIVLIFTRMDAREPAATETITAPPWDCRVPVSIEKGNAAGVWFLCNPVDGQWHERPGDKPSCRCAEAVTSFRFVVLESDCAKPDLWLPALVQMPIAIAAIYTSGKRSIHALWKIDAPSKAAWDAAICPLKPALKLLGADPGALSAVRLTRLPGCERGECGGKQRLLYLNPDPQEMPICEMPVRESRAAFEARMASARPSDNDGFNVEEHL